MAKDKTKKKNKKAKKKSQALPTPPTPPSPVTDAAVQQPESDPGRSRTPAQHCLHCKQPMIYNGNERPLVDPNGQWICVAAPKANSLHTTI